MSGYLRGNRHRWRHFAVALGISLTVLLLLCWKTQTKLTDVTDEIRDVNPYLLGFIFLVSALIHIPGGAYKWYLILGGIGCKTTYREVLFVRLGSDPIRFLAPFKTGELSNIAYFWRKGKLPFARSASWILFDKALNIGGTLGWLAIGLGIYVITRGSTTMPSGISFVVVVLIALAATLGLLLLLSPAVRHIVSLLTKRLHPRAGQLTDQLLSTFEEIPWQRKFFLFLYSIGFQFRPLLLCYLLMLAFRAEFSTMPRIPALLVGGALVTASGNLPYLQWGAGGREWALTLLFSGYLQTAASEHVLIAIGMLMMVSIHLVPAMLGLPFLPSFINALRRGSASETRNNP